MMTKKVSAATTPMFLALGCVGFLTSPARAADPAADPATGTDTSSAAQSNVEQHGRDIVVTGARGQRVESPKATAELLNTPQTVTVISSETLRRQNLLTLRDALATAPGITFGAGEGGGGYGDAINLRGYSANNDITIDGVRDSAQYSRTDPFNLQQIEIYNGANSVFNGSGSVGGTINLVSKVPQARNSAVFSGAVGTDNYWRATADINRRVNDLIAVRVNAMWHRNDVPGRDVEDFRRWGFAPSITFGIDAPTSLTLAYVHQRDNNTPVYGIPYFLSQLNNGPLAGADDSAYYGYRNLDEQRINVDRLTATFNHDFNSHVSVRNITRWQQVDQYTQTSAPQGTFCLASTGLQPISLTPNGPGAPCTVAITNITTGNSAAIGTINVNVPAGQWQPNGPRGRVRDQSNSLLHSQTDLHVESGQAGSLHNVLVVGGSLSWEDYGIETAELIRNAAGAALLNPLESISNPTGFYSGPVNYTVTARSRGRSNDRAIYAFDTLELGAMFELNAGIRYEQARATFTNVPLASYPPGTVPLTALQLAPQFSEDNLFSYRVGAVFKPSVNSSLYVAYGNARTPTSATVRLGCGVVSAPGAADPCAAAPETAVNYEIGGKIDLLGRHLQLTAALFRNERSNYRVASNDPSQPAALQVVDGRSRVDGLALGATGNLSRHWTLFANYTWLKSDVLQSVSDFCLANPRAACLNSAAIPDPQHGDDLIQTPKHSGSLFTTYQLPFGLQVGYGFTYQGSFATNQRTLLQRTQYRAPDWLIHRFFLSYEIREGLTAQLNITNFTDKHYFTGIRNNVNATTGAISGGWATPGDTRSAVFTVTWGY